MQGKFKRMLGKKKTMFFTRAESISLEYKAAEETHAFKKSADQVTVELDSEAQVGALGRMCVDSLPILLQDEFESLGMGVEAVETLYESIKSEVEDEVKSQMIEYVAREGLGHATLQEFWDECINGGCDAAGRPNPFESRSTSPLQELWKAAFSLAWFSACDVLDSHSYDTDVGRPLDFQICADIKLEKCCFADRVVSVQACMGGA